MAIKCSSVATILLAVAPFMAFAQQAGITANPGGGSYFNAEQYKIDRMKVQPEAKPTRVSYEAPKEFDNGKSTPNDMDDIWIGGYCRFKTPRSAKSRYGGGMSEEDYCAPRYPEDTIRMRDNFDGKGTIPWAVDVVSLDDKNRTLAFLSRMNTYINDGLPLQYYDSLQRLSSFSCAIESSGAYKEGRNYEFSRAVHIWIKRKEGSEKAYVKFDAGFAYSNGKDDAFFEINDKGQYKLRAYFDNGKTTRGDFGEGKIKNWRTGDWNEVTISKDEFNTVAFFINGEYLTHYQTPDIPIATRFASFFIEPPYEWEKKGIKYNIGEVMIESYPRK